MEAIKNNRGSALIVVLMAFVVVTILGMAIIGVTTSEHSMTKIDGRGQSTYYIAEAGISDVMSFVNGEIDRIHGESSSKDDFFNRFDNELTAFITGEFPRDNFEDNFGQQPEVAMDLAGPTVTEDTREYLITARGSIGDSKRTVNSTITLTWTDDGQVDNVLFYTKSFKFQQGSTLNAQGHTIVISKPLAANLNGAIELNAENIYLEECNFTLGAGQKINGNTYADGNMTLSGSAEINGDLHVSGNLKMEGSSKVYGNVFVYGNVDMSGGGTQISKDLHVAGKLNIKNATLKGNVNVAGDLDADGGAIFEGKLTVGGNAKFKSATLKREAHINKDLTLDWTPTFNDTVYHAGTRKQPDNFNPVVLAKCKPGLVLPIPDLPVLFEIPKACSVFFKDDTWYTNHGYEIKRWHVTEPIVNNARWVVNSCRISNLPQYINDVVIISDGDIELTGGVREITGVLISINGTVKYSGGGNFKGVVISNAGINFAQGRTFANVQSLQEYFETNFGDIPVRVECSGSGGPGDGGNSGSITISKSPNKEG